MGIPVYDMEEMFSDEEPNTACSYSCCSCHSSCQQTDSTSSEHFSKSTCNDYASSHYMDQCAFKDIVGNCKEVRIDENTSNLRIVGNNNRIRISVNTGDIIVIGNNTRLKIQQNHGYLKYTGNDGRICLSHQSPQQIVDYIGCNGVLKIFNSKKSSETENENKPPVSVCNDNSKTKGQKLYCHMPYEANKDEANKTTRNDCPRKISKCNRKSHSYSGPSCNIHAEQNSSSSSSHWKTFNHMFQEPCGKSMPNLIDYNCKPTTVFGNRKQPARIIQTIGNIVVANASNVCISPCVRTTTGR